MTIRYIVVIDGEHYPPVVLGTLAELRARGDDVVGIIFAGGVEKLREPPGQAYGRAGARLWEGGDARRLLDDAITGAGADAVLDLSDDPVLDYRRRLELAAVALARGMPYRGADFELFPPPRPRLCRRPSVAVIGTGKRTGKTAMAAFAARCAVEAGRSPVIVAMGRGGPSQPQVLLGNQRSLTPEDLVELSSRGAHAASDYVEDALVAQVPTVGARRCGSGLAGGVAWSNFEQAMASANALPGDLLILEGSGSAIPPVHADATLLVVPASIPLEYLGGYLGPYRLLLADCVVVTMAEDLFGSPFQLGALRACLDNAFRQAAEAGGRKELRVVRTVFRPTPLAPVEGATLMVATTAPEPAGPLIKGHLESSHGCRVAAITHALSDRGKLVEELEANRGKAEVLLCEIKAAAVDVATTWALSNGLEVVYLDNVPHGVSGDDPARAVRESFELAEERFGTEGPGAAAR